MHFRWIFARTPAAPILPVTTTGLVSFRGRTINLCAISIYKRRMERKLRKARRQIFYLITCNDHRACLLQRPYNLSNIRWNCIQQGRPCVGWNRDGQGETIG
uniref:Secreted protein n=1 Tax=Acrobeloides nanus TaxID=290746 RepID=A0A914E535_9BILA